MSKEVIGMCRLIEINTNFNTRIMVAEMKAEYIANILEKAHICRNISNIFLFGSVLKIECTEGSDIDVLVVSDITRSRLYRTKSYQLFLMNLHEKDNYYQQYDVICVHGFGELEKNRHKIMLYNEVLTNGKELYRRND